MIQSYSFAIPFNGKKIYNTDNRKVLKDTIIVRIIVTHDFNRYLERKTNKIHLQVSYRTYCFYSIKQYTDGTQIINRLNGKQ